MISDSLGAMLKDGGMSGAPIGEPDGDGVMVGTSSSKDGEVVGESVGDRVGVASAVRVGSIAGSSVGVSCDDSFVGASVAGSVVGSSTDGTVVAIDELSEGIKLEKLLGNVVEGSAVGSSTEGTAVAIDELSEGSMLEKLLGNVVEGSAVGSSTEGTAVAINTLSEGNKLVKMLGDVVEGSVVGSSTDGTAVAIDELSEGIKLVKLLGDALGSALEHSRLQSVISSTSSAHWYADSYASLHSLQQLNSQNHSLRDSHVLAVSSGSANSQSSQESPLLRWHSIICSPMSLSSSQSRGIVHPVLHPWRLVSSSAQRRASSYSPSQTSQHFNSQNHSFNDSHVFAEAGNSINSQNSQAALKNEWHCSIFSTMPSSFSQTNGIVSWVGVSVACSTDGSLVGTCIAGISVTGSGEGSNVGEKVGPSLGDPLGRKLGDTGKVVS